MISLREYQEILAANKVAEGFLAALGAHNWTAAYAMLAPGANPYATRSNQWAHEYIETFTLATIQSTADSPDSGIMTLEPCGKSFAVGAYKTPFFYPNKAKGISTQIVVALAKQNGSWLVSGENNNRHDPSAVVSGDPYGIAQAQRAFINPFNCD